MIGQKHNIELIDTYIQNNTLPKFIVFQGIFGSGKKTMIKYISDKMHIPVLYFENNVDGVRQLITTCYSQSQTMIYAVADCDDLSSNAQNSLLKICEEPPKNVYIMLTTNEDCLLRTIKSRAVTILMEDYSDNELREFIKSNTYERERDDMFNDKLNLCNTPGGWLLIQSTDIKSIKSLCDNIVDNISRANIGSALGITKKLKLSDKDKDNNELIDYNIFINMLFNMYFEKAMKDRNYCKYVDIILQSRRLLRKNLNKQYIFDNMFLQMRSA